MRIFPNGSRPKLNEFLPVFVLVVNSFTWYGLTSVVFAGIVNNLQIAVLEKSLAFAAFYVGMAFSAIVGWRLFLNSRRFAFLLWILAGISASLLLTVMESSAYLVTFATSLLLGVSIGTGLPSCLAYFADSTTTESRGLFGGITYGVSALLIFSLGYVLGMFSSQTSILILAIWRALGLLVLIPLMKKEKIQQAKTPPSYFSILGMRIVVLYLISWIMLCLVNWTEAPLVEKFFGDSYNLVVLAEFAISAIFTFMGGIFADLFGRKRVIIAGFIMLGIEYAALSLLSEIQAVQYLYVIFDGVSWGMFSVVFFMVLWGDIAGNSSKEKYYALGGLPYLLAGFLSILVKPYIEIINISTAFSLASFFLFLAVLPLMFAPETLPEKRIKERELKGYVEKAKKTKEKYT